MARRLRWTEAAALDLEEAALFIARDSPFYAAALVRETRAAATSLKLLAERGRRVPEAGSSAIREIHVQSYRLIYEIRPEAVVLLAFVHGARDLGLLWAKRHP
ncbi:MAG: type II toxin-antitoxin system RelE/ParE family toxin [Thermoanaerobaculia bacterium]|nr:type II toxin-antitoxin system RelE/ParE family toxin [Thermoanaerobaculia bacterium]